MAGRSPPTCEALAWCPTTSQSGRSTLLVATRPRTERRHSCLLSSSERVCLSTSSKSSSFRSVLSYTMQLLNFDLICGYYHKGICSERAVSLFIISNHRDWKGLLGSCGMSTHCGVVLIICYRLFMITKSWLWLERQAQERPPRSLSTWLKLGTPRVGRLGAHSPEEWLPCPWLKEYPKNTVVVWDKR